MNATVIIPWRSDNGWRQRVFDWVLPAWQATGFGVSVGFDDGVGPMNVSMALNRARDHAAGADVFVVASADHVPNPAAVQRAVDACADHPWAPVFSTTTGVSLRGTNALLAGSIGVERLAPGVSRYRTDSVPFCTALVAVRADAWLPWDERFHGWGCEDTAYRLALETIYPDYPTPDAETLALWHEAAPRDRFDANCAILSEYLAAAGDPDAMRRVVFR